MGVMFGCVVIVYVQDNVQKVGVNFVQICMNLKLGGVKLIDFVVGFLQFENEQNLFCVIEIVLVCVVVKVVGVKWLLYMNVNVNQVKQVVDIESMINQGVQVLIVVLNDLIGLQFVFVQVCVKGILVVMIDCQMVGMLCQDFIMFFGFDFFWQGQCVVQVFVDVMGGKVVIVEIQGGYGNIVESQCIDGFVDGLKKFLNMKIVVL